MVEGECLYCTHNTSGFNEPNVYCDYWHEYKSKRHYCYQFEDRRQE